LIEDLQSQIDDLEDKVRSQSSTIAMLEAKLDSRYEEIFRYRVDAQKARQESTQLQQELKKLLTHQE
jgi:peptidoglycan hydrolase CwlO-like protein